jgi:hypothetical protein
VLKKGAGTYIYADCERKPVWCEEPLKAREKGGDGKTGNKRTSLGDIDIIVSFAIGKLRREYERKSL